jgi:hypothetical protein
MNEVKAVGWRKERETIEFNGSFNLNQQNNSYKNDL